MKINVLDHGYVEFVEAWGHGKYAVAEQSSGQIVNYVQNDFEVGIIEAARQSTQGNFRGWDADSKLLKHLYNNNHATPFEFAGMVIEVQAPLFVFREWHRHRTQSYNEMSARYAPLPDKYYMPEPERVMMNGGANKQAQKTPDSAELTDAGTALGLYAIGKVYQEAEAAYKQLLCMGYPKELARLVMPVGHYSRMRASANLRNWLAFLTLRMDPLAQWEIRQYAEAVGELIADKFPQTWKLFKKV